MIRENLITVEPRSLGLILLLISLVVVTAMALYLIKPQYQRFNANSNSFAMLNGQIDDKAQLQRAIDSERNKIKEMQLKLHGEAGDMPVNEMEAYLVGRLQGLAWAAGIELAGVRPDRQNALWSLRKYHSRWMLPVSTETCMTGLTG